MLQSGELPAVRIGRSVRISQEWLRAWVSDRTGGGDVQTEVIRPNVPAIDLDTAFHKAGFDKLGTRFTAETAAAALRRLAGVVKDARPLVGSGSWFNTKPSGGSHGPVYENLRRW